MNVHLNAVTENECIKQLNCMLYVLYNLFFLCYFVYFLFCLWSDSASLFNSTKFLNISLHSKIMTYFVRLLCYTVLIWGKNLKLKKKTLHTVCFKYQ